jgi:hypothetical protein
MVVPTKQGKVGKRRRNVLSALKALRRLWRPAFSLALAAGFLTSDGGCTRCFYRNKADEEVSEVLAQKDKYPAWAIEQMHVYPDPRARFADADDPDHPAMPPDDPASYAMAPHPQKPGKAGVARTEGNGYLELIARWDLENRQRQAEQEAEDKRRETEPPQGGSEESESKRPPAVVDRAVYKPGPADGVTIALAKELQASPGTDKPMMKAPPAQEDVIAVSKSRSLLDVSGRPTYLLTLDQAAELAQFNSREYQNQRENLYLAALPVTQERFSFSTQLFAVQEAVRAYSGRDTPAGQSSNWTLNNGTGFGKILPTGALLLLNFSNRTVFNFLDPKTVSSVTTLNFDAIQPLLRNGGEAVALESLTQSERNLLYSIRNFARFRKELYVEIASNNGGAISGSAFQPTGVLSGNNVSGNAGLGNSGLFPGVIRTVAPTLSNIILPPTSPGNLALGGVITPAPSGYLNTMLQKIQVYIDQENIDVLSGILLRYRGLLEGDVVQPLQVQNVEQQLLTGRSNLLTDQQQYLESLNSFKLEIGVPMHLSIEMDDSVLQPLLKQFRRSRAIIDNEHAAVDEASALIDVEKAPTLRAELRRLFTKSAIVKGTPFAETIRARWLEWERLSIDDLNKKLGEIDKEIKELLDRAADLQKMGQSLGDADRARSLQLNRQHDLGNFEKELRAYELAYVDMGKPKKPADAVGERQRIRQFQKAISLWQKVLVEARDNQWDVVRANWPELPRCCVDGVDLVRDDLDRAQTASARHALENRLDLMNSRAQVVDAWRQLAVYANALLGTFTVSYNLSANSPLGVAQPLNIGGSGNSHQLVLDTELPLVRIQERNNYRASIIAYQRQRRVLQQAEDLAVQAVDQELFLLRQYAEAYKLQQRQLELAYLTIDSSLESLQQPPAPPTLPGQKSTPQDGPAALTQQLLAAQRSLPTAQNALLTIWINYLDQRLQLYRDLELMPLDARGVWIDEIRDCDCSMGLGPSTPSPAPAPQAQPQPLPLPADAGVKQARPEAGTNSAETNRPQTNPVKMDPAGGRG